MYAVAGVLNSRRGTSGVAASVSASAVAENVAVVVFDVHEVA
jgi:hypothetical protein